MRALSLFNGASCLYMALERLGYPIEEYVSYEIDEAANLVTAWNYPDVVLKGSVVGADFRQYRGIDLLGGGSPCQDLSTANSQKGKKRLGLLGAKSSLFWEYVRALDEAQPKYFIFENNYGMPENDFNTITDALGVYPILINSQLVSAQHRKRWYWTNIPNVEQPEDRGILLPNILQSADLARYKVNRTPSRDVMWYGGKCKDITNSDKSRCLTLKHDRWSNAGLIAFEDYCRFLTPVECERLQTWPDGFTEMVEQGKRYELTGNGWTTDVIAHILSYMQL